MKRAAPILGVAVLGSQAGHLVAYELRFGATAQQLQSTGAHAYFPLLAKTVLGGAAMVLIAALLVIGFARFATGRGVERESAPGFVRLLAVIYTIQLAFFVAQETLEGSFTSQLVLWGFLGQLPVAAVGALALRWLLARLGPALAHLVARCEASLQVLPLSTPPVLRPASIRVTVMSAVIAGSITRRGPPSF
jgi:hypothetical protein